MKRLPKLPLLLLLMAGALFAGNPTAPLRSAASAALLAPPCLLPAPTGFMPVTVTPTSIKVKWNPVSGAVKYRVRIQQLPGGNFLTPIITDQTMAIKTGLTPGTAYRFFVEAKCADGGYSMQAASLDICTGIIITDVIVENCCPLPTGGPTTETGSDVFCLSTGLDDSWHIKAQKYSGATTTYYDFCVKDTVCGSLIVSPQDSLNTEMTSNDGKTMTVKTTSAGNFLTISEVVWDVFATTVCFKVTWKIKMKVWASYCDTVPLQGNAEDRRLEAAQTLAAISEYRVAPNPFREQLRLQLPENQAETSVAVLVDARARIVRRAESNGGTIVFDTDGLPAGLYFVRVQSGSSQLTFRAVKQE